MTDLLCRIFIKNRDNLASPHVRNAYGSLAGAVGIVCNLLLFAAKLTVGTLCGSVAVTADAVNNLSDAASGIISLLGFRMAARPADADHPFGHARYEYLAGLTVAVLILSIGVELLRSSIGKLITPTPVAFSAVTVAVLIGSIAVKLWLSVFYRKIGKKINSGTLTASSADSRNDVISSAAVLLSVCLVPYIGAWLDSAIGVAVALFILYSGIGLIRDTLDPILGKAPDPVLVEQVRDEIMRYPSVLGTHDLMIHDYGPGKQFASVHVEVDAAGDIIAIHDEIDNIEHALFVKYGLHTVIHMDPIVTGDSALTELRETVSDIVTGIDPQLSIHDLRMVPGTTHTTLVFDCVVPPGYPMSSAALCDRICSEIAASRPDIRCAIHIEESYASLPHTAGKHAKK